MKFSIGYYEEDEAELPFGESIRGFADAIGEVYFPWPALRTCRAELAHENRKILLLNGLYAAKHLGARLSLLANANCYGANSLSKELEKQVRDAMAELTANGLRPNSVTTTSPYIASVVKKYDPSVEVRASVNMRLGTYWEMEKLFDLFDGFYCAREYNYKLDHLRGLKEKLERNGKKMYLLANSGCMSSCPGQIFHDNLVAHEEETKVVGNPNAFEPYTCWRYYRNEEHFPALLKNTWIRPEDVYRYEGIVDTMKLATRNHMWPTRVIRAYAAGKYDGNPLGLTEPSHASLLFPGTVHNDLFPDDWFEMKSRCTHNCDTCGYCDRVWEKVYTNI